MLATDKPKRSLRRPLIITVAALVFTVFGILLFDAPLPDDSDFVLAPAADAHPENALELISTITHTLDSLPEQDGKKLREMLNRNLDPPRPWDADFAQRILDDNTAAFAEIDRALAIPNWDTEYRDPEQPVFALDEIMNLI